MKTTNNTILITGGGSGIGFETAKAFDAKGNNVIIAGRNETKLANAAAQLKNATAIACDITSEDDLNRLVERIDKDFSGLNILVNNAGKAHAYTLSEKANAYEKAKEEIMTNLLSTMALTEKLLPVLSRHPEAAIVNISSITAFVPAMILPSYSASKAALHSYTKTLRLTLQRSTGIKVFEVMPPLVDTEFSRELPGNKMPPADVASEILNGLENNTYEIHVGATEQMHKMFLASPVNALNLMNGIRS